MSIIKVIELMANSKESWEDAAQKAVSEASKSVKNIRSIYVKEHGAQVINNVIKEYRVTVSLSFEVDEKQTAVKKAR